MLNDAALNVGANAIAAAYPYLSLHTSGDVTQDTNESTAPRIAADWSVATGDLSASARVFTGGASGGPCVRVGYWSAAVGGTYGGGCLLVGDQAFNVDGEYTVTSITENGSSS